jgi:hypothetical protein
LQKVKRRNLGKAAVLTSLARGFQRSHRWTTTFYRGKTFSAASFRFGEVADTSQKHRFVTQQPSAATHQPLTPYHLLVR